ncbi:MAG: hypothetical protein Kow00127_04740 [Bacteroidales bacterium]
MSGPGNDEMLLPVVRVYEHPQWVTYHLLVVLILLAWIRLFGRKRPGQFFLSFFSPRLMSITQRETNILTERISIAFFMVYIISVSLYIYLLLATGGVRSWFGFSDYRLFGAILLFFLAGWIFKALLVQQAGNLFGSGNLAFFFILIQFLFSIVSGLILLLFVIPAFYLHKPVLLFYGGTIWALLFIIKMLRIALLEEREHFFSYLNRFVYLCTFEIIPVLIFIKLIYRDLKLVF